MPGDRLGVANILPAVLVIGFLCFDAAMPLAVARMPDELPVLMFSHGVVIAEIWLLAVWAALGSAPWGRRVAISLVLSMMSVGLFEHGLIYIATWGYTAGIRQVFLAPLELITLACPLLVLRGWRGWHFASDQCVPAGGPQRFSLRQLFFATALVAAAIPVAQLGVAELPTTDFQRGMLVGYCITSLTLSALAVIPLTWLCLKVRFPHAVTWLGLLAIATNCVAIALMCCFWTGRQLREGLAGLAFCDAVPLTYAGILLLLRRTRRVTLLSGGREAPQLHRA